MKNSTRSLRRMIPLATRLAVFAALASGAAFAQDSSGNALLNGTFRFRYVGAVATNSSGVVTEVTASEGVITFLGNGTYTIATGSQWIDNTLSSGKFQTIPSGSTGTYSISPAGIGSLSNPNPNPNLSGVPLWGTFSQGVFTASSTENIPTSSGFTVAGSPDLFVAVAVGPIPTNASFTSPYWIGALDYTAGVDADVKNAIFEIAPNGSGSLGSLMIQGQANNVNGTALTQNITGATYSFASDGNAQFSIPVPTGVPTPQVLVSGSRTVYESADGNFLLGWTPNGYDIMFGVKAPPASVAGADNLYTGLYYVGGTGDNPTFQGSPGCGPFGFWGSENADGNQNEIWHQRLYWPACANFVDNSENPLSYDLGTWNLTGINPDGSATDLPLGSLSGGNLYGFGDTGANCVPGVANAACAFVEISNTLGNMALSIGIHAPNFTPSSGVFLNPVGVVNAASWNPITASVAPGELLTLFGSFGSSLPVLISTGGQPFPTSLGPIQVFINGIQSPIYYISPTQISVIAPYELANTSNYAVEVQVSNNNALSNETSILLLTDANSGIYAANVLGYGPAVALHSNFTQVCDPATQSPCSGTPAQPGETIVLALTGMGTVTPAVGDGQVPSSTVLSYVDDFSAGNLTAYFQDYDNNQYFQSATIAFAGLYPGLASLYQMNVTVPTTVGPGDDIYLEIISPYADTVQVSIPIGGSANPSAAKTGSKRRSATFGQPAPALPHRPAPRALPVQRRIVPASPAPTQ
jgi:uncharacterized protein (TIGR03437 family)